MVLDYEALKWELQLQLYNLINKSKFCISLYLFNLLSFLKFFPNVSYCLMPLHTLIKTQSRINLYPLLKLTFGESYVLKGAVLVHLIIFYLPYILVYGIFSLWFKPVFRCYLCSIGPESCHSWQVLHFFNIVPSVPFLFPLTLPSTDVFFFFGFQFFYWCWKRRGKMLGPIYRLKDVIVGGHRRGSLIRGSSSSEA